MAFLGGLQGLGGLASGITQGIGQGTGLNQYLQNQQAQNLAGNVLQAYGGGQSGGGLQNVVGGQGSTNPISGLLSGLTNMLPSGAGAQPVSSQDPVPGLSAGQPGTANQLPNVVGGGQQAAPGMSPFSQQQPSLSQPQQAQPQPQPDPSQSGSQPAPFDASGRMAGATQQMTLPQFVQMVRKVSPNASGRQVMMAAEELGKAGLIGGFGGITPYQAAGLELRREGADVARERLSLESQKLAQGWDEFKTREKRIESNNAFAQKKVQSALAFRDAQMKVLELQKQRDESARTIQFSSMDDNAKKQAMDELNKKYEAPIGAAQKIADDALKASNESAPSEDSGGGGGQADYANTPDGKMMHYKGNGSRDDPGNWEEVQ